ncbi:MAG: LysR family transcriptional regulator [Pseudomonas sp.]|uniref:LysR family transcriptional regulator n=1 Tax=Pseudomonas abieticivorans TaxID=2931382 RepID=UPI0020BE27E3|nr:LysR family transcriptional regulator [Pseudomonas sp. PIA16]MDE1168249.1 LysR family transcriptional regulator [Pseudomonas sp.]
MPEPLYPIDSKQLILFDEIYRTQSITRAAERLGLAQPTVSIWLKELRRRFDDTLFVRTGAGMLPTAKADALISIVRQSLESLRSLDDKGALFDPATCRRTFRLAMNDASHISVLPRILGHLRQQAPLASLNVVALGKDTAQHLEMAEVDLAIGYSPELGSGVYQQALFSQDFICLVSAQHPRIGNSLSREDFEREAHIAIAQTGSVTSEISGLLAQQDIKRNVVLRVESFMGLNTLIATSDLIATVPRQIGDILALTGATKALECPVKLPAFVLKQHWHARFHEESANRWLRSSTARLFERG